MGPCIAVAVSLVAARERAVASALMFIPYGVIGGAIGPFIVGAVSDALPHYGADALRYGLATLTLAPLVSGISLWIAFRHIRSA